MQRTELLDTLARRIVDVRRSHPVRVAIDGVDGVGKTTLADELAFVVSRHDRPVIRASIDGFHHPRSVRYRMGRSSAEGYFRDSFDHAALTEALLAPLGRGGTREYRRAVFDYRTDAPVWHPVETAAENAILLFDGIFLHRPELAGYWDMSIFLDAPFEITVARMGARGGTSTDLHAPENRRYVEGQELYLHSCEPRRRATLVVNNADLAAPRLVSAGADL